MSNAIAADLQRLHTQFDIDDPLFSTHFEVVLDHLLTECPVASSELGAGDRVFSRYRDARRCAQNWRVFSSAAGGEPTYESGQPRTMKRLLLRWQT